MLVLYQRPEEKTRARMRPGRLEQDEVDEDEHQPEAPEPEQVVSRRSNQAKQVESKTLGQLARQRLVLSPWSNEHKGKDSPMADTETEPRRGLIIED